MKYLEMKDKVSIITPCFNSAEYISDCIDSVGNQSYLNWEMIIIDDNSSDQSVKLIKKKKSSVKNTYREENENKKVNFKNQY